MNISQIKEKIPLSDFLEKCGHAPVRSSANEKFYRSPYRKDADPSLTVNDRSGKWYDHGDAKGGNIIDIAALIWNNQNIKEVVARINEMYSEIDVSALLQKKAKLEHIPKKTAHEIVRIQPLGNNFAISGYLQERGVYEAAQQSGLLKEVYYDHISENGTKKRFFGVGWQNESGGWEIRSKYGKTCIAQKDILVRNGTSGTANVFEGMMDYLSALTEKMASYSDAAIVLNGLAMSEKAIARLREITPRETKLFLDNGTGGDRFTKTIMQEIPKAIDMRGLYSGYGDYNEKICAEMERERNSIRSR